MRHTWPAPLSSGEGLGVRPREWRMANVEWRVAAKSILLEEDNCAQAHDFNLGARDLGVQVRAGKRKSHIEHNLE